MSHNLKKTILRALESDDLGAVAALAEQDRKVLSALVRLAYDKDTLVGWRAIKAAGLAARVLVTKDHEFLRDACRKLLWSLTDESGGIGWSAPELLGEIVSADPGRFADIIPLIAQVYDIEEKVFRPGIVYAFCRIAESSPQPVAQYQKIIISSLVDEDPLTRIHGLRLVDLLWQAEEARQSWSPQYCDRVRSLVASLQNDFAEAWIYGDHDFLSLTVAEVADKVVNKII
jgi:hypothetical protein